MTRAINLSRRELSGGAALLGTLVFVLDILTPRGIAVSFLYVLLVLLALWSDDRRDTLGLAVVSTILTILGYVALPVGTGPWALVNRALSIVLIWSTAALVYRRKASEQLLHRSVHTLEHIVVRLLRTRGRPNLGERGAPGESSRRWTRFWKR